MTRLLASTLWCPLALGIAQSLLAETPPLPKAFAPRAAASMPLGQLGAVVREQYSGDGLAVVSSPDGAMLRCAPQRLSARITTQGLSLISIVDGANGETFRVIARTLGRQIQEALPHSGKVALSGQMARFIRTGLREEYSVSIEGVRQDFVIERRPEGTGPVRLELEVDGAKAEAMGDGARLALADGGRKLVYNALKAEDAMGKELKARMEVVSPGGLAVVLEDADAVYPVRIDPTFSDANWISMNPGIDGANGGVSAAVVDGSGNLYIGGLFTIVGNVVVNNIAKWDGSSWTALGSGMNGRVDALAVSDGNVYAGWYFTTAGGSAAKGVAKWDGSSWAALGSGVGGTFPYVTALAVSGTDLYVGGRFATAGGATNYIAKWDGSNWSSLGSGMGSPVSTAVVEVDALAVSGNDVYAGGLFKTAGGVAATNIAKWDGSSWA
ncbi:MAG: hypothetical protein ACREIC_15230, partial [Limisphaerales bacterium]